jgi:arylsulfatase A-like enzyme
MSLAMGSRSGTAPVGAPGRTAVDCQEASACGRFAPSAIILMALWVGLVTGFLDLSLLAFKRRFIDHDLVRLGVGYPWIIPAAVAALVLLPGVALAAVAWFRHRGIPAGMSVGVPTFIGLLDVSTKFPLEFWSSSLLSAGLAVQTIRILRRRPDACLRLVRSTLPLLAGLVLLLGLTTSGRRAWSEHRALAALPPPPATPAPNVLLIVWDTVRAQSTSLHGYGRRTTPNLDRLAQEGVWFQHAFSTSSWTLPSHASLFTGRWPHELSAGWKTPLDLKPPTLAEALASLGYDTAGFVANLDFLGRETGVARGFNQYEDYPLTAREVFTRYVGLGRKLDHFSISMLVDKLSGRKDPGGRPLVPISREHSKRASDVDGEFLEWLSWQRRRNRPFFAFLNYNDAHTPYEVPVDSVKGFGTRPTSWHDRLLMQKWNTLDKAKLSVRDVQMAHDLYDDSIAYMDRRLGSLLDELEQRHLLDDTIVIVTADHGEHLGDHRLYFHGCSLYRQLVQVPLVFVNPRRLPAGRTIAEPASLRDVPATILDLAGLAPAVKLPGRSLARFWEVRDGAAPPAPVFEPVLMETERPEVFANHGREPVAKGPMQALVAGGMHYIRLGDGSEELYALGPDPEEKTNLAGLPNAAPSLAGFRGALESIMRGSSQPAPATAAVGAGARRAAGPF